MKEDPQDIVRFHHETKLQQSTLVLAFTGWMDGGDVSTGTVRHLITLLDAEPIAEIEPEHFYVYSFPGSMELAALFRPHIEIKDGLITSIDMFRPTFFCHPAANLVLFIGKEPNLRWDLFGRCLFDVARRLDVKRIVFVGSFGGAVPHTRAPRLYVTCSAPHLLEEMDPYGVRRSGYEGPGSFTSYLMTQAPQVGLEMVSLAAEIPGYLQGTNPVSIEAMARRLAKLLKLRINLDSLRAASTQWELQISSAVDQDRELAEKVHALEREYDNELLRLDSDAASH